MCSTGNYSFYYRVLVYMVEISIKINLTIDLLQVLIQLWYEITYEYSHIYFLLFVLPNEFNEKCYANNYNLKI